MKYIPFIPWKFNRLPPPVGAADGEPPSTGLWHTPGETALLLKFVGASKRSSWVPTFGRDWLVAL